MDIVRFSAQTPACEPTHTHSLYLLSLPHTPPHTHTHTFLRVQLET